MKRLLGVLLMLAFASTAQAATIGLGFGAGTTGVIDGNTVTLGPSDWAVIDVLFSGENGWTGSIFGITVSPPDGVDFTFEDAIPGPLTYPLSVVPPVPGDILDGWAGAPYPYPYVQGAFDTVIVSFLIHCTGTESIHDVMFNDLGGEAGVQQIDFTDYPGLDFATPMLTIIQVPEPASFALLALGGLALLRRR
jgi:hypothetical protein